MAQFAGGCFDHRYPSNALHQHLAIGVPGSRLDQRPSLSGGQPGQLVLAGWQLATAALDTVDFGLGTSEWLAPAGQFAESCGAGSLGLGAAAGLAGGIGRGAGLAAVRAGLAAVARNYRLQRAFGVKSCSGQRRLGILCYSIYSKAVVICAVYRPGPEAAERARLVAATAV